MTTGVVTVNDSPSKSKLYRFCEKKIDQWIKTRLGEISPPFPQSDPPSVAFKVSFTEESGAKQVSCETEIHLRGALWKGYDLANDTQNAFMHSLKRLKPH